VSVETTDVVQAAATIPAAELDDQLALALRGSNEFSLIYRFLRERDAGVEYRFGLSLRARIRQALHEILAIVARLDELGV